MTFNDAIEKSLLTWYPKDHPLHLDPLHPAIKLAGEAGEILDCAAKDRYKPGFSMWTCTHCKCSKSQHYEDISPYACKNYTPLILDELGDWWYYWRILAYQFGVAPVQAPYKPRKCDNVLEEILKLNITSAKIAIIVEGSSNLDKYDFYLLYARFTYILEHLSTTLDKITELNYIKLNSDPTNHGWKGA